MANVMKTAWEIAYEGVEKFGGKVKEYFSEALKIAWDLFKKEGNEMKVSKWKVSRGPRFVEVEMSTSGEEIVELTSNGVIFTNCERVKHGGGWAVKAVCPINGVEIFVLSAEVDSAIWGTEAPVAVPAKKKESKNHLCKRCGSYCWGDCQAN